MLQTRTAKSTIGRVPTALRAAREFTSSYQDQLNAWREDLDRVQSRPEADIRSTITRLYPLVVASRIEFEREAMELPVDVERHGILREVRQSLRQLADELVELWER